MDDDVLVTKWLLAGNHIWYGGGHYFAFPTHMNEFSVGSGDASGLSPIAAIRDRITQYPEEAPWLSTPPAKSTMK